MVICDSNRLVRSSKEFFANLGIFSQGIYRLDDLRRSDSDLGLTQVWSVEVLPLRVDRLSIFIFCKNARAVLEIDSDYKVSMGSHLKVRS